MKKPIIIFVSVDSQKTEDEKVDIVNKLKKNFEDTDTAPVIFFYTDIEKISSVQGIPYIILK